MKKVVGKYMEHEYFRQKRLSIISLAVATLISIAMIWGTKCSREAVYFSINLRSIIAIVLLTIPIGIFVSFCYHFLSVHGKYFHTDLLKKKDQLWKKLFSFCVMMAGWLPYWLAAYPGFFCYDTSNQFVQHFYKIEYSKHHPLLSTIYMVDVIKVGYKLTGDFNAGIALLSLINMIVGACVFTFVLSYLRHKDIGKWVRLLCLGYYAFFPTIAIFANCTCKDVMFTYALTMFLYFYMRCGEIYHISDESKKKYILEIGMIFSGFVMLMWRNNAVYAFALFVPLQYLIVKDHRNRRLALLAVCTILYIFSNIVLNSIYDPKPGSTAEKLSIPSEQLARVYLFHGGMGAFDEKQRELLDQIYLNNFEGYCGINADVIKSGFIPEKLDKHMEEFVKLWIDLGIQYPKEYLEAAVLNTYQAWFPFTDITGYQASQQYEEGRTCYFACDVEGPGEFDGKNPALYEFIWNISREYQLYKIPVIGLLFTVGFHMWMFLFAMGYSIYIKNYLAAAADMIIMAYVLTVFLGPLVLVRYYLILFYAFPFFVLQLCEGKAKRGNGQ